jgi:hypothetical protein
LVLAVLTLPRLVPPPTLPSPVLLERELRGETLPVCCGNIDR